ncbi:MAG TPA: hypothetical protein PKI98_10915, partial [Chitinophagaceae bacterium]|nr:hypothetical protein [Chitinophagaceae bacterium]
MKIFIVDFSPNNNFLLHFQKEGLHYTIEKNDGGNAYKTVATELPEKIFVNFASKPSHCIQTIKAILNRKTTSKIEIFFVDGDEKNNEKVKELGTSITYHQIKNY